MAPAALAYLGYLGATRQGAGSSLGTAGLLALSGPVTTVPLLFFGAAAKKLRLSTMGILQYLSPTLQSLLAVVAFHKPFSTAQIVSFGCIWAAIAIYTADSYRAVRQDRLALVEPFGGGPVKRRWAARRRATEPPCVFCRPAGGLSGNGHFARQNDDGHQDGQSIDPGPERRFGEPNPARWPAKTGNPGEEVPRRKYRPGQRSAPGVGGCLGQGGDGGRWRRSDGPGGLRGGKRPGRLGLRRQASSPTHGRRSRRGGQHLPCTSCFAFGGLWRAKAAVWARAGTEATVAFLGAVAGRRGFSTPCLVYLSAVLMAFDKSFSWASSSASATLTFSNSSTAVLTLSRSRLSNRTPRVRVSTGVRPPRHSS